MRHAKVFFIGIMLLLLFPPCFPALDQAPKLTVVIVIDQCAYHYFPKLQNHFKYAFKELINNSAVFTKAHHPHGIPETTTGHHGISTGCYPKDHGGITNQWLSYDGQKVHFETDNNPDAAFVPTSKKSGGKSGRNTMVDNLSDQFLQFSTAQTPAKVFALCIKSYPAIVMAGKMGKALWFDDKCGTFMSSKKYFDALPSWVNAFNQRLKPQLPTYTWQPCYKPTAPAYNYPFINNYEFAGVKESYINKSPLKINPKNSPPYATLVKTPFANNMLLELAKECINNNLNLQSNDRMLLWVSLSSLDLLTHLVGPDSLETTDMLYQLDRQLKDFITFLHRKVGASNCLIALTADHGVAPIPEIQQKKGDSTAKRIMAKHLINQMNNHIQQTMHIATIVKAFEPNSFRLNHAVFDHLKDTQRQEVLERLLIFLKAYPGIKDAWTYDELAAQNPEQRFAGFYKTQLFPGRIGEIICLPAPYCQITHYPTGTTHCTPYHYDTHVPLFLYQPGKINPCMIHEKVFIPQLPVTLAKLLHITKPSASGFDVLPGF